MEGTVKYPLGASSIAGDVLVSTPASITSSDQTPSQGSSTSRLKQIWAIGGGKGGVGKSLLASSLAIALSRMGHRTIAIDLDLGGANLHTNLGVGLPKQTLSDYINQRVPSIEHCLVPSGIPHLDLISGAQDSIGVTTLRTAQKTDLLNNIRKLDSDYVIFDLGAGTGFNTLDFFLFSDVGIVTLLPEPTSIENAYRFIKSCYFRYLAHCSSLEEIQPLIEMAMDIKNPMGIRSPADLFKEVNQRNPELGIKLKREIEKFHLNIVVNQTRTQTDIEIGTSVKTVCKKYFGIEMDYIGHLDYDSSVWQAVRRKRPLLLEFPNSRTALGIEQITRAILKRHSICEQH